MSEFGILFVILGILGIIVWVLVLYSDWKEKRPKKV